MDDERLQNDLDAYWGGHSMHDEEPVVLWVVWMNITIHW
jgi:hypothetical protein